MHTVSEIAADVGFVRLLITWQTCPELLHDSSELSDISHWVLDCGRNRGVEEICQEASESCRIPAPLQSIQC